MLEIRVIYRESIGLSLSKVLEYPPKIAIRIARISEGSEKNENIQSDPIPTFEYVIFRFGIPFSELPVRKSDANIIIRSPKSIFQQDCDLGYAEVCLLEFDRWILHCCN